jgi:hypothetical protein
MYVDIDDVLKRGGAELIGLFQYCVYSVQIEPVFIHLAGTYASAPTAAGALALYDAFLAPAALARLRALEVLEPRDLRLARPLQALRALHNAPPPPPPSSEEEQAPRRSTPGGPPRHLFEFIVEHLRGLEDGPLQKVAREYDPALTARENLPGGKLNEAQRYFVDKVWLARVRPMLVKGGFWRVATVG